MLLLTNPIGKLQELNKHFSKDIAIVYSYLSKNKKKQTKNLGS
tara:strand:- start:245 stop:373 length:129 start_codon:yes stop_codon:yes gene_type:complete